jgi:hypothetical protein
MRSKLDQEQGSSRLLAEQYEAKLEKYEAQSKSSIDRYEQEITRLS